MTLVPVNMSFEVEQRSRILLDSSRRGIQRNLSKHLRQIKLKTTHQP